jgi:chromosome segregation ATPase
VIFKEQAGTDFSIAESNVEAAKIQLVTVESELATTSETLNSIKDELALTLVELETTKSKAHSAATKASKELSQATEGYNETTKVLNSTKSILEKVTLDYSNIKEENTALSKTQDDMFATHTALAADFNSNKANLAETSIKLVSVKAECDQMTARYKSSQSSLEASQNKFAKYKEISTGALAAAKKQTAEVEANLAKMTTSNTKLPIKPILLLMLNLLQTFYQE